MSLRRQAAGAEINSVISDSLSISCSIPDSPVDWRPITTHLPYRNRDRLYTVHMQRYQLVFTPSTSLMACFATAMAQGTFRDTQRERKKR